MKMVYQFRAGSRLRGSRKAAQAVGEKLQEIRKRHGGLTPPRIVEAAQPKSSVLHPFFTWDDRKAAAEYRLHEARLLVCSVVTVQADEEETRPVRSFVSVGDSYQSLEVALSSAQMRQEVLREVLAAISSLKEKLKSFEEFQDVLESLDQVQKATSKHFVQKARNAGVRGHGPMAGVARRS